MLHAILAYLKRIFFPAPKKINPMKDNELRMLREARELIAAGWSQHAMARDKDGKSIQPHQPEAVCFCLIGAMIKARGSSAIDWLANPTSHLLLARNELFGNKIALSAINDTKGRKLEEIIALYDKAIEICQAS